jgi:hypothetical protein
VTYGVQTRLAGAKETPERWEGLVVNDDDKYRYCPPWSNAEIIHDETWTGLDTECLSWNTLVQWRIEDEAAGGD